MHRCPRRYNENDKDEDGYPKEPIAFWVEGEEWRALSFDESRLDDTTHGAGGDRKGRTELSLRCGPGDDGECIGQKSATHTSSIVGGSNALGEPLPAWFSVAASEVDDAIFSCGPVAVVGGQEFPSRGMCNPKGSVDGKHAVQFLVESLVAMCSAHGRLRADRRAVVACDGVGTHMTDEFLQACRDNFIVLVLRTPWCSNRIQFEDIVNFWQLKNCRDVGWYKVKQQAVLDQLCETGSTSLSHAKQLSLIVPAWNNAFSKETNLRGWRKGGFALDGIRLTPLWAQRNKDLCASVKDRARSRAEERRGAIQKLGLGNKYDFDKALRLAPHKRTVGELMDEVCAAEAAEEDAGAEELKHEHGHDRGTCSTRSFVCEQQLLQVPSTGDPAMKLKDFHNQIVELSKLSNIVLLCPAFCSILPPELNPVSCVAESAKAPRVAELMQKFCPGVDYKVMDEAKARLAHVLEEMFNLESMTVNERNHHNVIVKRTIQHKFQAYHKLNKAIQEKWDVLYPQETPKKPEKASQEAAPLPFGYGAFKGHRNK